MAQNHIDKTICQIKTKLDEILSDYFSIDTQISVGLRNDPEFFGSYEYYQLQAKRTELGTAHTKLTDALVALETYLK